MSTFDNDDGYRPRLDLIEAAITGQPLPDEPAEADPWDVPPPGDADAPPGWTAAPGRDDPADYRYIDWAGFWDDEPPVTYVVPGLVPADCLVVIFAPSGAGKSLLALEWAVCLATGRPILGEPVAARPVLYIDQENPRHAIRDRLDALGAGPGTDLSGLHYSHHGAWGFLDEPDGGRRVVGEAARVGASVVFIDTTGRVIAGNENDADTFANLWRWCLAGLRRAGRTVVLIDHTGKDLERGQRGSSAKGNDIDLSYQLTDAGGGEVVLRRHKNRVGLQGPASVRLARVGGDGDEHLRHEPADPDPHAEARVLAIIDELDRLGAENTLSRRKARELLRGQAIKVRDDTLAKALSRRACRGG